MDTNQYVPPTLTVDLVVFRLEGQELQVLLTKRTNAPFKGQWALPGGYSAKGFTTMESLTRMAETKIGLDIATSLNYLEQLYTFDTIARDPRGHAVSVTYFGAGFNIALTKGSQEVEWRDVDRLPTLAFDHEQIIAYARSRFAAKITYSNAARGLLDKKFTLSELQTAYEAVLGKSLDKRNFRKRILGLGLIYETSEMIKKGAHRPAMQYSFGTDDLEVISKNF